MTRAADRAEALFGTLGVEDDPDDDQGSRARQAVHEHVALHEVRGREPVLHDRRPGRRGLHERPARDPRGLPARRRPARARASPPARACSRTRCSSPPSRRDHFPMGQAAMQVNEGLPAYIVAGARAPLRRPRRARPSASSAWRSRPSRTTPGRRSQLQAAQAAVVGGRAVVLHRPVRARRPPDARSSASSKRATSWSSARRTRRTAASRSAARTSWTSGARWARDPALVRILVTGAAGFINGYLVPELLEAGHDVIGLDDFSQVRPADEVVRRPPALSLRRGRRQGRGAADASSRPTATRSWPPRR